MSRRKDQPIPGMSEGDSRIHSQFLELQSLYLDIMLCKFLGQSSSTGCEWVDGVIDCYLAILVIQEVVYVFSALLKNPLPERN